MPPISGVIITLWAYFIPFMVRLLYHLSISSSGSSSKGLATFALFLGSVRRKVMRGASVVWNPSKATREVVKIEKKQEFARDDFASENERGKGGIADNFKGLNFLARSRWKGNREGSDNWKRSHLQVRTDASKRGNFVVF